MDSTSILSRYISFTPSLGEHTFAGCGGHQFIQLGILGEPIDKGDQSRTVLDEFSAAFFSSAWRQFRKRNAYPTAITQNVEYLLDSVEASSLVSNSELVVMLNQAASDREKLGKLLNISSEQMSYITNADAGCGLIKYGSALVPFVNRFPKNTKLYELMTTTPGEGVFSKGGGERNVS